MQTPATAIPETLMKKVSVQIDLTVASGYRSTVCFKGGGTARPEPGVALLEAISELTRIALAAGLKV